MSTGVGMKKAMILAGFFLAAGPATAADWLDGVWCDGEDGGLRLIIDPDGLGFYEHTICEWIEGRPRGARFATAIQCANVYPDSDDVVRLDARTLGLLGDRGAERVTVIPEDGARIPLGRCDL